MKSKLIMIILITLSNVIFAQTDKRIALIIGNSAYQQGNVLKNPVNDANLMIQTLKSLGFEVISRTDATKQQMEQAVREFSKKLPDNNIALFYYAGHGLQVDGTNYLIPIDANLNAKEDCKYEAIAVNFVVEEFEKYPDNTNIVILDACRNNPFRSWARGGERGFKAIAPTSGTIIAFATSEGSTASDGSGSNGLFTQELVKQLKISQPIESVFKKNRVEVEKLSNGAQSPQEWSKLKGDFYFVKSQGNQNNNYSNNDQPEIGTSVSTYGIINLTTEIAGDLYLDGKKLATINANKQIPIKKIISGNHIIEIKGNEYWKNEVIVSSDNAVNVTAYSIFGIFTDNRDNKTYKTVKIGDKIWMNENLAYKTDNVRVFQDNPLNVQKYGYLYDWNTAQKVCPTGWHIPSANDFEGALNQYLKGVVVNSDWSNSVFKLDLEGGIYIMNSYLKVPYFWTSSEHAGGKIGSVTYDPMYGVPIKDGFVCGASNGYNAGFSVRCIKND